MVQLLALFFLSILPFGSNGQGNPPSPGFSLSQRYPTSLDFAQKFKILWGAQNQKLDDETLTVWLDQNSGSGFESRYSFSSGYAAVEMKLPAGYTAGTDTSFYLSSTRDYSQAHDEIDIEFLGNVVGKPYVLQTNVLTSQKTEADGSVDEGRERQFCLWFDPTQGFHQYALLWNKKEVIFFVDDVPIRRFPNKRLGPSIRKPLWVFGSIWDASSWATDDGQYKANYNFSPFVAQYRNLVLRGCHHISSALCPPITASPSGLFGLSPRQMQAMTWVQKNYLLYDYCNDTTRNSRYNAECFPRR